MPTATALMMRPILHIVFSPRPHRDHLFSGRRSSGIVTVMARVEKKADNFGQHAQEMWDAGRTVHTPRIPYSVLGTPGDDVALTIESITAVGWRLHAWAVTPDSKNPAAVAYPVFVRP